MTEALGREVADFKAAAGRLQGALEKTLRDFSEEIFGQSAGGVMAKLQHDTSETVSRMTSGASLEHDFPLDVALIISEAIEALEEWRQGRILSNLYLFENGQCRAMASVDAASAKPVGVGAELADVFIRLLDVCNRHGYDLWEQYQRVMEYNRTRNWAVEGKST